MQFSDCAGGTDSYCDTFEHVCKSCTDYGRFSFGVPAALGVALPAGTSAPRFPRAAGPNETLFYTVTDGSTTNVAADDAATFPNWNTPSVVLGTQGALGPLVVDTSTVKSWLTQPPANMPASVLLFDAPNLQAAGVRQVVALPIPTPMPAAPPIPLALPGGSAGASQIRIAIAPGASRAWWLGGNGLVTATLGAATSTPVPMNLSNGNPGLPNQPWVTPDGSVMLFVSQLTTGTDLALHLFYARMSTSGAVAGQQASNAVRVFQGSDVDGDPSLTANSCALLFTRAAVLYGAVRN
jgi:hypothetical protein